MLDLYDELVRLTLALDEAGVEYALCGGLALAVWGYPRATVDIDLVVHPQALPRAMAVAESLGYAFKARPMSFSDGAIVIHQISKTDERGDVLMLDFLLVTPAIEDVWETRARLESEHGPISVVSREGLIKLKSFRSSGTDRDDIARLQEDGA